MEFLSLETNPEYINLQTELVALQKWVQDEEKRLLIIFEGRDTAGKGGAIMRFVRFLNPRGYRIVALPKPTEVQRKQWYFQRYFTQLPDPGEIAFFDRSWYNRAVVEPVMGFCTADQYESFMDQVTVLEEMMIRDGIIIIKLWFSINTTEQQKRLAERKTNPLMQWKLSTVDSVAQQKWDDYTEHKLKMFMRTSSDLSPWVVINGNDKDKARLEAMRHVINVVNFPGKGKTGERLTPDDDILTVLGKEPDLSRLEKTLPNENTLPEN